ncbi:hypothetical protein NM432_14570 [Vibrio metschnikovii]|nr:MULTISPECIES: hypothetical protein [Vibrio]
MVVSVLCGNLVVALSAP